jgi:radical SAM protein with 4Fe4S-binding SPASM domain
MHVNTLKFYKYTPVKKPIYKGKFCSQPFDTLQIDSDGDVQLCDCQLHMPYSIGNIYQNSLQEIWLGDQAEQVRQSVRDEDFTYCNWACSVLTTLPNRPIAIPPVSEFPSTIKIDLDRSCNLKCPSCREDTIMEKNSLKITKQIAIFEEIKQWALENPRRQFVISPMASGEIFASHSGLIFLKSLIDYPGNNLQLEITTNGTLINRNRALLLNLKHLLKNFSISIDAATPETYALVRGGDWSELQLGLEFLHDQLNLPMTLRFCIQKNNWHEIEQFAELAGKFHAAISYQKLLDWGHWTIDWWHKNNVFDRTQSTFEAALEKLKLVKQTYPGQVGMPAELTKYIQKQ